MLGGTGLESAARSRAANILYKEGQRDDALELLQAKDDAPLPSRLEGEIAQAQLLSNGGEGDQALARIDDALARFPDHPDVLYQKAILLEKAGRTDAAIAQLETLYRRAHRTARSAMPWGSFSPTTTGICHARTG